MSHLCAPYTAEMCVSFNYVTDLCLVLQKSPGGQPTKPKSVCINFVARSVRLLAVSDVSGTEATNTGLCGVLGPISGNMLNSL